MALDGPSTDDPEGISQLRSVFVRADYTPQAVARLLRLEDVFYRDPRDEPLYVRRAATGGDLGTLVRLFLLAAPLDRAPAAAAVAPLTLERLEHMGLVEVRDGRVRPAVEIAPVHGLYLASDQAWVRGELSDHVLGFAPPTGILGGLLVKEPVESALDLGTGGGYQALKAAGFARRVVGVDINPRALRFARFNALLNGVGNIELREGSLFEPVAGERFDLALFHPPYVISPETTLVYRDSGPSGPAFCEAVVRELPAFLAEGGYGIVLITWIHRREDDWSAPVRGWLEGSGCDAVLLRYASWDDPLRYAAAWNRGTDAESYAGALDEWTAYHRALGIERIAWGAIALRRRNGGPNWFWAHAPATDRVDEGGRHLLRLFAAQDFLRRPGGAQNLLGETLVLSDDHRFEQSVRLGDAGGPPRTALRLQGGLGFKVELDAVVVGLLARLRSDLPLGDLLAEAAESVGVNPGELAAAVLPGLASLLELGLVRRSDGLAA